MIRLTLLFMLVATSAAAQSSAYERGVASLEAGDTEAALEAFQEAFEAEPDPTHALALAATHQQLGQLAAAVALYDRLLAGELGELSTRQAEAVEGAREAAEARVARLVLRTDGDRAMTIEVDGRPAGRLDRSGPLSVPLDPGQYRVSGRGDDDSVTEILLVAMDAGQRREATLTLGAPPAADEPAAPVPVATEVEPEEGGSWAPWLVIGGAALPLALGITGGVLHGARLDDADAAPSQVAAAPLIDDARRFGRMATVSFVVAGVMVAGGVLWWLLAKDPEDSTRARLGAGGLEVHF